MVYVHFIHVFQEQDVRVCFPPVNIVTCYWKDTMMPAYMFSYFEFNPIVNNFLFLNWNSTNGSGLSIYSLLYFSFNSNKSLRPNSFLLSCKWYQRIYSQRNTGMCNNGGKLHGQVLGNRTKVCEFMQQVVFN